MQGMGSLSPNQSATALGHSNAIMSQNIGSAGQSLVPGNSFTDNLKQLGSDAAGALPTAGAIAGGIVGTALGGAAGIETGPGAIATAYAGGVAGSGVGASAGEALKEKVQGQPLQGGEIAKQGIGFGALDAIGGPLISAGGKLLKGIGETVAKAVIPTSIKEAGMEQTYKAANSFPTRILNAISGKAPKAPQTVAQTVFDKGLMGTQSMLGIQAKRATSDLWNKTISPALEKSDVKVNMPDFFNDVEKQIVESNPEKSRQADLIKALDALKEDYKDTSEVPLSELQKFKEGWTKKVPEKAYKGQPIAGAFNDVLNVASGTARNKIYSALGDDVKQAYFDYGNLKGVQELGKRAMTGSKFKGGTGTFLNAAKDMAAVPIGTSGGQIIYKVGQGVELLGKPGAKTVRDILYGLSNSDSQGGQTNN